jgi:cytochrome c
MFVIPRSLFPLALLAIFATPAFADGDAEAGKRVFNRCMACHDGKREVNKVGPHLVGVVGRKAGGLESFVGKYSDAMTAAGAGGLVWDEANLASYIKDPKGFIPGNRMAFAGIKDDEDIANLIAWPKADAKP